jgi:sulfate permease, SulP family
MSIGKLAMGSPQPAPRLSDIYTPKSLICFREGYTRKTLLQEIIAGITVGVIAIPLALAFAIASHVSPERGLYTAIVGGFLISLLGGSRVLVAGPTGAFVIILVGVVDKFGYEGLALAGIMAGVILILMGVLKLGAMIKFIPYPVTTGFTSGIALIIFSQQMPNFFGMQLEKAPSDFVQQWRAYFGVFSHHLFNNWTAAVAGGSLLALMLFRRFAPRIPSYIVVVIVATLVVGIFHLDSGHGVATIESRFGGIPSKFPPPGLPKFHFTLEQVKALIPHATTIAMLAAIESLLCAVVADGMIGGRHKSNLELCAQGVGNIASIFFGGIPATGAIARTAANVKAGGRTPLAGMIHAVTVLLVMLLFARFAGKIPLAVLAAVLVMVAYNMSELDHFRSLFRAPRSDIMVLLTTFGLTVFLDLTVAVGVGMVLASMLFMKRMAEVTNVGAITKEFDDGASMAADQGDPNAVDVRGVPKQTEVYEISGPFFFGVADRIKDTLSGLERPPRVFILRMRYVDAIDATGMHALDEFYEKCRRQGTILLLAGVHAQPIFAMTKYGLIDKIGEDNMFGNIDDALNRAREIVGEPPKPAPLSAVPEVAREAHSKDPSNPASSAA